MDSEKISIRFFEDQMVRAQWDGDNQLWWYVVTDIVAAITKSENARKYWSVLKTRLKKQGNELATNCSQLKFEASDGKKYNMDCIKQSDVEELAKLIPSKNAITFLDWFTYSDNTIDGRSKKKAYTFWESNLVSPNDLGTVKSLQQIHGFIFGGLYDFAGKIRNKTISKGGFTFCLAQYLDNALKQVERMPENNIDEIIDKYVEMNVCHPFMEGNGRSTRIWLDLILRKRLKKCVDWSKIDKQEYLNAMIVSHSNTTQINRLIKNALTDEIDDRQIFMKGIDYSYYYEEGSDVVEEI
ncbi:MAG: Fic family protein [Bacteroidales bacterium]|nr:Fic family protein [Bacteroidales bacterium]